MRTKLAFTVKQGLLVLEIEENDRVFSAAHSRTWLTAQNYPLIGGASFRPLQVGADVS